MKKYIDRKRTKVDKYRVGDLVMLDTKYKALAKIT